MDYKYSKTMKKLMKRQPSPILQIVCILILAILVGGSIYGYRSEKRNIEYLKENVEEFDPARQILIYSEFTPVSLSEEFAVNYDNSIFYNFAFDDELNTYILAINSEEEKQYQDLIDYTYIELAEIPKIVTFQGMPVKMNGEMLKFSIEEYNKFWGGNTVNIDNYKDYIGNYYLDTTQGPPEDFGLMTLCVFLFIGFTITYIFFLANSLKLLKRRQVTLNRFSSEMLWDVDQEIDHTTAVYFDQQKLYITRKYIVSTISGFDIIPLEEILHIFGLTYTRNKKNTKKAIVVETIDGIKHEIAVVSTGSNGDIIYKQIIELMKQHLPNIKYGFDNGFYTDKNSNLFLGILGAILGAALGGLIWIILGEIGIIVGLAGFLMIYFAVKGYRYLSGPPDKKGLIASILIAFIMIFLANYTRYALDYCNYYYSSSFTIVNIIYSFYRLPRYFTWAESWGGFLRDILIGYLFSAWATFRIYKKYSLLK